MNDNAEKTADCLCGPATQKALDELKKENEPVKDKKTKKAGDTPRP